MKKLFFTLLTSIVFSSIYGQVPQEINYQGVARNSSGTLLSNQNIGIKLDLHQGSAGGTIVFSEAHNKTTNVFGLFTLGIGSVNASGFIAINWANGPYFLEVSMDPAGGTSYSSVGTQQFMSVPYALYAQTAGNASATPTITINAPNTVTSSAGSYTINVPAAISYSAGTGIDITGGVISNTASATTPTIIGTGATTVTGTYPNLTINTPTVVPDQTVSLVGTGNATVTGSYPNFTVNVPNGSTLPTGLNGQFLYHTGTIWDTLPRTNLYFDGINFGIGTTSPQANFHVVGAGRFDASVSTPHVFTNTLTVSGGTLGQVLTSDASGNGTFQNLPSVVTTSLTQGANVTVVGSATNYTVSAPAYSITLPGGNTVQITNGVSTSTAAINATSLTLTGVNNNILSAGGNTVALNTYTAGTGISITGSAPNYVINNTIPAAVTQTLIGTGISSVTPGANTFTVNTPMPIYTPSLGILSFGGTNTVVATPSLSILGNVLRSGPATNTVNLPASVITGTGTGIATVTTSVNNFTVNVPAPTYTASNGVLGFGTNTLDITPTLSLTGTTLTSGAATNSVSLAGLNGIYGGSGSIQTGSTTVTVGTNTLTFLSGATTGKPIANFYGGGITGSSMNLGHIGTNSASLKFIGSATTTPVDYGYVSGSTNGISISGGTSSNGLYATNTAEVGVGTFTTGTGKFVITHTASQANPTMHLRETSGGLNRIKFSNNTVANKFFETAAQTNAVDANGAYSINYFDGITYKPVLLVTGERKVNINNLNTVLGSLHVMENGTTAGNGIISEGFSQPAQINLARNNQPALAARTAVISGDELGRLNFAGYDGAAFGDGAKIYAKAAENVTGSNKGTELIFSAVPTGTNTNKEVFKINGANKLEVITSLLIPFNAAAGKVLTSDALGNASWQNTANTSPWIQGTGIVTQTILGDNVGIGINTPQSPLHIANAGGSQLRLGNNNQPTMEWMWNVDGTSHISLVNENNGTALTRMFMDVNTGNLGLGTTSPLGSIHLINNLAGNVGALVEMNATTNTDGVRVVQAGTGNGIFSGVYNASSPAKAIEAQSDGTGVVIGASTSGSGSAGVFNVSNAANTSNALQASTNGSGSSIASFNSGTGNAGYFIVNNASSNGTGIQVTTTGTGNALNANANTGTAINAVSGGALATMLVSNSSSGDGLQVFAGTGRGINATNTSNIVSAAQFYNDGTSNSLLATKNSTTTGGNVARFENNSTTNTADAEYVKTLGAGAAIHAVNGPTVTGGSNVAMWLESGHLKTTGAVPTYTLPLNAATVTGNDIVGTVLLTLSASTVVNQNMVTVFFNKPYSVAPNVMLYSNNANAFNANAFVTGTTTTSFTITFATSVIAASYSFKYLVIE